VACKFCPGCKNYVCSTVHKELHSFKTAYLHDLSMMVMDAQLAVKPRRPSGVVCTTCATLFCFMCYQNDYCSQRGCTNVCCENCGQASMYFCVDWYV
jgi:hypothetical protein